MMGKNAPFVFLILLLIAGITSVKVSAPPLPYISLNPTDSTVQFGDSFTVDVHVNDVTDLGAWAFSLNYNTTILDAISVSPSPYTENNTDWVPVDAVGIFHPDGPPTINDTIGRVEVGALVPAPLGGGLDGSFPLVTINFTATGAGDSALDLNYTVLGNSMGDPLSHTTLDGLTTVVPEFPSWIAWISVIAIISLAVFLGSRKLQGKKQSVLSHELAET